VSHWVLINPFQPIYMTENGGKSRDGNEAARFASKDDAEVFIGKHGPARYFVTRECEDDPAREQMRMASPSED